MSTYSEASLILCKESKAAEPILFMDSSVTVGRSSGSEIKKTKLRLTDKTSTLKPHSGTMSVLRSPSYKVNFYFQTSCLDFFYVIINILVIKLFHYKGHYMVQMVVFMSEFCCVNKTWPSAEMSAYILVQNRT